MENSSHPTDAPEENAGKEKVKAPDLTGQTLGEYKLLRRLGQGGMGQVYLAEQVSLKRKVALKLLRGDLATNEAALQRFKREAEAVARATHGNIVQVYAIGQDKDLHYMALEYVEGKNLRDFIEKKGPPDVLACLSIIRQVASALQRAGELGVIHRDIKPENILITRKSEVKVTDFGLSRVFQNEAQPMNLTQSGMTMGTPLYMSPEQVEGKPVDPRTDIYSLGVTAYHLLTGQPPFRGATPFEVAVQHVQNDPPPLEQIRPDLPPELCKAIRKMMAKKPQDRYQTAQEIVRDMSRLRDLLVGVSGTFFTVEGEESAWSSSVAAMPTQMIEQPNACRRLPWMGIAALLLVALAGGAMGVWWKQHSADPSNKQGKSPDAKQLPLQNANKLRERQLVDAFKKYPDPQNFDDKQQGMYACINLGLFYLERDFKAAPEKFTDAQRFFDELRDNKQPKQYQYFGNLGQAMVLAFTDNPYQSNNMFIQLVGKKTAGKKKGPGKKGPGGKKAAGKRPIPTDGSLIKMLRQTHPELRQMLSKALQRNYDNDPKAFPENELGYLRRIPQPPTLEKESGKER